MDNITRTKMRIGDNEFDAEGTQEYVRQQFQDWMELVKLAASSAPTVTLLPPSGTTNNGGVNATQAESKQNLSNVDSELTKIMRADGRYISLTARAASVHDAVLILLYGQKVIRNNESVTGTELLSGLASTGGFGTPRLDRILDKLADDGEVMSFGERRGKKYRLTNTGLAKARTLAGELVAAVA